MLAMVYTSVTILDKFLALNFFFFSPCLCHYFDIPQRRLSDTAVYTVCDYSCGMTVVSTSLTSFLYRPTVILPVNLIPTDVEHRYLLAFFPYNRPSTCDYNFFLKLTTPIHFSWNQTFHTGPFPDFKFQSDVRRLRTTQGLENGFADSRGRSRVLAGDKRRSRAGGLGHDDLGSPWLVGLDIPATGDLVEFRLQHEGHGLRHLDLVLLGVGEAGDLRAGQEGHAGRSGGVEQSGGTVADGGDELLGRGEGLDQC